VAVVNTVAVAAATVVALAIATVALAPAAIDADAVHNVDAAETDMDCTTAALVHKMNCKTSNIIVEVR